MTGVNCVCVSVFTGWTQSVVVVVLLLKRKQLFRSFSLVKYPIEIELRIWLAAANWKQMKNGRRIMCSAEVYSFIHYHSPSLWRQMLRMHSSGWQKKRDYLISVERWWNWIPVDQSTRCDVINIVSIPTAVYLNRSQTSVRERLWECAHALSRTKFQVVVLVFALTEKSTHRIAHSQPIFAFCGFIPLKVFIPFFQLFSHSTKRWVPVWFALRYTFCTWHLIATPPPPITWNISVLRFTLSMCVDGKHKIKGKTPRENQFMAFSIQ